MRPSCGFGFSCNVQIFPNCQGRNCGAHVDLITIFSGKMYLCNLLQALRKLSRKARFTQDPGRECDIHCAKWEWFSCPSGNIYSTNEMLSSRGSNDQCHAKWETALIMISMWTMKRIVQYTRNGKHWYRKYIWWGWWYGRMSLKMPSIVRHGIYKDIKDAKNITYQNG